MHEIVTLQCGPNSNGIATHWWNLEIDSASNVHDEVRQSALFESTTEGAVPRTIVIDHSINMGDAVRMTHQQPLGAFTSSVNEWQAHSRKTALRRALGFDVPGPAPEPFRDAYFGQNTQPQPSTTSTASEPTTKSDKWHQYANFRLRPRQQIALPTLETGADFDIWPHGVTLCRDSYIDSVVDQVRWWAERCDSMQAIQLMADSHNAFGGFASEVAVTVKDEYERTSLVSILASDTSDTALRSRRAALSRALTLRRIYDVSSAVVPLHATAPKTHVAHALACVTAPIRSGKEVTWPFVLSRLKWRPANRIFALSGAFVDSAKEHTLTQVFNLLPSQVEPRKYAPENDPSLPKDTILKSDNLSWEAEADPQARTEWICASGLGALDGPSDDDYLRFMYLQKHLSRQPRADSSHTSALLGAFRSAHHYTSTNETEEKTSGTIGEQQKSEYSLLSLLSVDFVTTPGVQ
ncbi:MAG: hypothetical protein MHM6MM_005422 [Cercozoa sp. M6MM]